MRPLTALVVMNLSVVALTAYVFWLTRNPWSFLLLLLVYSSRIREE